MFCNQKIGPKAFLLFFLIGTFSLASSAQSKNKEGVVLLAQNAPTKRSIPTKTPVDTGEDEEEEEESKTPIRDRPEPPEQPEPKEPTPPTESPAQGSACANQLLGMGLNVCTQLACQVCDWKCQLGLLGGGISGGLLGAGTGYVTGLVLYRDGTQNDANKRFNTLIWGTVIGGATGATIGGIGGFVWSLASRTKG